MAPKPFTAWNAIVKQLNEHDKMVEDLRLATEAAAAGTGPRTEGLMDVAPEAELSKLEKKMLGGAGRADNDSLYAHLTKKKAASAPSVAQQKLIKAFLGGSSVTLPEILEAAGREKASDTLQTYFKKRDEISLPQFLPENDDLVKNMQAKVLGFETLKPAVEPSSETEEEKPETKKPETEAGTGAKAEPKAKPVLEQPKPITPRPEGKEEEDEGEGEFTTPREPPVVPAPAPAPAPAAPGPVSLSREDALARANPDAPVISDGEKAAAKAGDMQNDEAKKMQEMEVGSSGDVSPTITDASKAAQGREQNVDNLNPTAGGESRQQPTEEEQAQAALARELDLSQAKGRRAVIRTEATIPTEERVPAPAPAERIAGTGEAGTEAAPVENLVLEDVARDGEGVQGAMISTPAQAMKAAGSDSKDDEKEVAGLSIEEAKRRIRALHQVFDSMIKAFREKPHTKDRDDALNSSDPKKVKAHLLSMLKKVREYYEGSPKGLKVGVIVPMEQLVGAILGRAGMSGIAAPAPAGPVSGQPIEAGKVSTASADRVHPGEFLHKAKEDRFGRAISLSIHRRNSGMDAYKRRGVRNHAVPVSQTITPGPVADPKIRVNQNVPFGGVFGGVVQGRNPKSMGIRIKT